MRQVSKRMTHTVEDYLKAIYGLEGGRRGELVGLGKVAERLGVTAGTVTTMMRQLKGKGLIGYEPRRGVYLTGEGRVEALRVIRRHRMVELFLVDIMEVDWAHVHEEAEALEHAISDRLLERMDQMLDHPTHDPHGDPIPDASGGVSEERGRALIHCKAGRYRVVRVLNDASSFLNWLEAHGLQPGREFTLKGRDDHAGTLDLQIGDRPLTIGGQAAGHLEVASPV